jgi:flagellar hook-associated protein 2
MAVGTITSGVGIISGLDITSLVDSLIAVESRPRDLVKQRISTLDTQRIAYSEISARISAMLARITTLSTSSTFKNVTATSSDSDALSVSATAGANLGAYSFRVQSLATTQQFVSKGFRTRDAALPTGQITIESGQAKVGAQTYLDELNGHDGISRGSFRLIDGNDESATIDISDAKTLADVIERINNAGLNISADIEGESIALTEKSGGKIEVREIGGGRVAESLGFSGSTASTLTGMLTGADLMRFSESSPLDALNDGLGIRRSKGGGDFTVSLGVKDVEIDLSGIMKLGTRLERLNRGGGVELGEIEIQTRDGGKLNVDLSSASTIQDIKDLIEGAGQTSGGDPSVTVTVSGDGLRLVDNTEPVDEDDPNRFAFKVTDVTGNTARDLGIDGSSAAERITGQDVLHMDSVSDILLAINYAEDNVIDGGDKGFFTAQLAADGRSLEFRMTKFGQAEASKFELRAGTTAALADLGFEAGEYTPGTVAGQRIVGGIDTTLLKTLNGGQGIDAGQIEISTSLGSRLIDASSAETLRDVIDLIEEQAADLGITVGLDRSGRGIQILQDGAATGTINVADAGGSTLATDLGLVGSGTSLGGKNLQRQYIRENTLLSDLNQGTGVGSGKIQITDSTGFSREIDFTSGTFKTVQDILNEINGSSVGVEARINSTGDGIEIIDTAGGDGNLEIEANEGQIGARLNLIGESSAGSIDGTFEYTLDTGQSSTLDDLISQINDNVTIANASILNDGSTTAPYRLTISSAATGSVGELIIDSSDGAFDFNELVQAQDATITLGDGSSGFLVTSSDNVFEEVIEGLTLTANNTTTEAVNVTVDRSNDALIEALSGFVEDFNSAMDRIREVGSYNLETEQRGVLFGETTIRTTESRLFSMVNQRVSSNSTFNRLSQLGLQLGTGSKLEFDESKFREALDADPQAVSDFFSDEDSGWATTAKELLEAIVDPDGLIDNRTTGITKQQEDLQARVEELDDRLEAKRAYLTTQFINMETALAQLQSQQSALGSLSSIAAASSVSSSG